MMPASAWDWSGAYLGGAIGAKWTDLTWSTISTEDPPFTFSTVDASSPRHFNPFGPRVGVYGGYNWQSRMWVYGLEFDAAYANKTAASVGIPGCTIQCTIGFPGPGVDTSSVRMGSDASVRARIGYLMTPSVLLYATGRRVATDPNIGLLSAQFYRPAVPICTPDTIRSGNKQQASHRMDRRWRRRDRGSRKLACARGIPVFEFSLVHRRLSVFFSGFSSGGRCAAIQFIGQFVHRDARPCL